MVASSIHPYISLSLLILINHEPNFRPNPGIGSEFDFWFEFAEKMEQGIGIEGLFYVAEPENFIKIWFDPDLDSKIQIWFLRTNEFNLRKKLNAVLD